MDFRRRVEAAAADALARRKFVTPVEVCVGLGWLRDSNLEDWRRGRVDDLEYFLPVHDDRLIDLITYLHEWSQARGLTRVDTDYVSATRDRRPLRFFTNGEPIEEAAWRSQWISGDIPAERRADEDLELQARFVAEIDLVLDAWAKVKPELRLQGNGRSWVAFLKIAFEFIDPGL